MPQSINTYDFIKGKINSLREAVPSLRTKADPFVFSALCVKSNFYKNPALTINESDYDEIIVDGQYDGGVDILLSDPNSEASDLVIGQSKFYQSISYDDVLSAMLKMALFYKDMDRGHYEQVNEKVQRRFLSLNSEVGDESKIHFVFYTSAPQGGIRRDQIEKKFREQFSDSSNIEVSILFAPDIEDEIKESESRRPSVEIGKITIDQSGNYLEYGDDAVIVNVSAFSIKQLYAQHNTTLLARNLRYHIAGRDIDKAIDETINNSPDEFWLRNNGITILCDTFSIDGRVVKLTNFSIVNGGQTTYMLYKSRRISDSNDLFLPCKIIRAVGNTEDEKNLFSLEIAKATNSQKAIKAIDLKANAPEQVRFVQAMREANLYYQTKRGESIPRAYRTPYLNTDLVEIGKLCLGAIFQIPCTSRSKPSSLYQPKYYDPIFNGDQAQIAKLSRELLYIDNYFRSTFIKKFDRDNSLMPYAEDRISFAHNARTVCVAFVAFASRYYWGNIKDADVQTLAMARTSDAAMSSLYDIFKNLDGLTCFLPSDLFVEKDKYDGILDRLFNTVINAGITAYSIARNFDSTLTATNFLKKDKNYYDIISIQWSTMKNDVIRIMQEAENMATSGNA